MDMGYSYFGEVRLGHSFILSILDQVIWPHILNNEPHLSP